MQPVTSVPCRLSVNGDLRECAVTPGTTLLEALRYGLGLTGSKQGCDKGDCGACTVLVDGRPTLACITLALAAEGHEVRTIEGLADGPRPHPLQDALDITGGAQCGFCKIARALSGNLCRCTGYTKIFEAVELAASEMRAPTGALERR